MRRPHTNYTCPSRAAGRNRIRVSHPHFNCFKHMLRGTCRGLCFCHPGTRAVRTGTLESCHFLLQARHPRPPQGRSREHPAPSSCQRAEAPGLCPPTSREEAGAPGREARLWALTWFRRAGPCGLCAPTLSWSFGVFKDTPACSKPGVAETPVHSQAAPHSGLWGASLLASGHPAKLSLQG